MNQYRARVVDAQVKSRLASAGEVVITGPRACGKTETARQLASSAVFLDNDIAVRQRLEIEPLGVLGAPAPMLIDEWQLVPSVWNTVRRVVDDRQLYGQFILTGSTILADDVDRHSGAGRFASVHMRPMALSESGHSSDQISMQSLLRGDPVLSDKVSDSLNDLVEHVVRGGWPLSIDLPIDSAVIASRDYLAQIVEVDARRLGNERRQSGKMRLALRALARHESTLSNISTLSRDVGVGEVDRVGSLSRPTLYAYLDLFEQLMIVEDQPAWSTHLRSKKAIRTTAKRRFVDPSLAVAAIGASPARLLDDLEYFGFLFESLVVRDVRTYAQASGASVFHYRDSDNLEVDIIVESTDGSWAAFEVKLGVHAIDDAVATLLRFRDRVDTSRVGEPSALGVIVGSGYGYTRPDGVSVVPITALTA